MYNLLILFEPFFSLSRYNIHHPVCNDPNMELWGRLGVTCWPTLLVLSPMGTPIHVVMGEGHAPFLLEYLTTAMDFFKGRSCHTCRTGSA